MDDILKTTVLQQKYIQEATVEHLKGHRIDSMAHPSPNASWKGNKQGEFCSCSSFQATAVPLKTACVTIVISIYAEKEKE